MCAQCVSGGRAPSHSTNPDQLGGQPGVRLLYPQTRLVALGRGPGEGKRLPLFRCGPGASLRGSGGRGTPQLGHPSRLTCTYPECRRECTLGCLLPGGPSSSFQPSWVQPRGGLPQEQAEKNKLCNFCDFTRELDALMHNQVRDKEEW